MRVTAPLRLAAAMLPGLMALANLGWAQAAPAAADPRQAVFQQHCAICHDNPATRAPNTASLNAMSPSFIVNALTSGIMQGQGAALSPAQRVSVAEYLTGRKLADETPMAGGCSGTASAWRSGGPSYNGWGANPENWRFQPEPGITAADLNRL